MSVRRRRGFSLIELMATVAIIAILSTIGYNYLSGSHARTQKELCGDNLQKIYVAMQVYGHDHADHFPEATGATTSEAALNCLVPQYTSDRSIFICPGSRDGAIAPDESLTNARISYAYYEGQQGPQHDGEQGPFMSDQQINNEPKTSGSLVFSVDGKAPGNNHGRSGGNFLMLDGSVRVSGATLTFDALHTSRSNLAESLGQ